MIKTSVLKRSRIFVQEIGRRKCNKSHTWLIISKLCTSMRVIDAKIKFTIKNLANYSYKTSSLHFYFWYIRIFQFFDFKISCTCKILICLFYGYFVIIRNIVKIPDLILQISSSSPAVIINFDFYNWPICSSKTQEETVCINIKQKL